ncbi:tetratricopeptide repeat protein [Chitinivibrio alkaliphilus]|uniref:Putative membrane protein n=1 Tax=Chitinivibrio alkaliphilus ACht1 TaxID=1313304 RepID=U7D8Q4_9BACT|nr:tetratricopeptide repeat protein [Chitinivibrio alkaliphilus]ERP31956.1 putative membrane protein [Chitinivibrio alkaliphilus ACht1]
MVCKIILMSVCFFVYCIAADEPYDTARVPEGYVKVEEPLFKPFIERYILDEIRDMRNDQERFKAEVSHQVAQARIEATDRSVRYTTDTVNNIFFIITAAGSLLVIVGWRSLSDIKEKVEGIVESKIAGITDTYQERLNILEAKAQKRADQIIDAQEEISRTNTIHSLWMRANLDTNLQNKIAILDKILEFNPNDIEATTHKADAVLELGESEWALNLSNTAIKKDGNYGYAYWQRGCAYAELGDKEHALADIKTALEKSPDLRTELLNEQSFTLLRDEEEFQDLVGSYDSDNSIS